MSIDKLKNFRQKIEELSSTIAENLTRIGELDKECMAKQQFIEQLAIPVIQNWTKSRRDLRQKRYKSLKLALEKMEAVSNEKVKIAAQSYETIDNYVVQLDKLYEKITQQRIKKRKTTENKTDSKKSKRKSEIASGVEVKIEKFDPTIYVDMPVDPAEPTYCICRQVSFGQMILCDGTNCPIEWFHFDCVGLKTEPKGKWYCGTCKERLNKK